MHQTLLLLCAGLAALVASASGARAACTSAERCIAVNQCPTFVRTRLRKNFTETDNRRWQKAVCGYASGSLPKVCCPVLPEDCGPQKLPEKLINGEMTVIKEFPWMARLGYDADGSGEASYLCGGSLISERYVVTAAHCVESQTPSTVRLGEWDVESDVDCSFMSGVKVCAPPVVDVGVEQVVVHPEYEKDTGKTNGLQNDIALIRLRKAVKFTDAVAPICMPDVTDRDIVSNGAIATVAGWGKISAEYYADTSRYLMKLNLRVMDHKSCQQKYASSPNRLVESKQICAAGKKGQDACKGDSGGPLMYLKALTNKVIHVLVGIVSFGPRVCATNGVPAVFTRVPTYMPWILSNMRF